MPSSDTNIRMYKQTYMFIHACETCFQSCSLELEGLFVQALTTPAGPRCTDFSYLGHSDCLFQENHLLSCPLSRTSSLCNKYTVVFISCHWLGHYTTKNSVSWLFLTCTHGCIIFLRLRPDSAPRSHDEIFENAILFIDVDCWCIYILRIESD